MQDEAKKLLFALVFAVDTAFISSWQSTAYWEKELQAAKDFLLKEKIIDTWEHWK